MKEPKGCGKYKVQTFYGAGYETWYNIATAQFYIGTSINKWNFSNRKYGRARTVKIVNFYS
jgi:hypothetical protein